MDLSVLYESEADNMEEEEIMKLFEGGIDVNFRDFYDRTPLHIAAINNNTRMARFLLKNGANINAKDLHGVSPLHYSAEHGSEDVAKLLLEKGAEPSSIDKYGRTPLHYAAIQARKNKIIVMLLSAYGDGDIDLQDNNDRTALHEAIEYGYLEENEEQIKLLLTSGAKVFTIDKRGRTPLHEAAVAADAKIFELLLKQTDLININLQDKIGRTPLHEAVSNGHEDLVKLLLNTVASHSIHLQDLYGRVPLQYARHIEIVKLLLENGADINSQDFNGKTLLLQCDVSPPRDLALIEFLKGATVPNGKTVVDQTLEKEMIDLEIG